MRGEAIIPLNLHPGIKARTKTFQRWAADLNQIRLETDTALLGFYAIAPLRPARFQSDFPRLRLRWLLFRSETASGTRQNYLQTSYQQNL